MAPAGVFSVRCGDQVKAVSGDDVAIVWLRNSA